MSTIIKVEHLSKYYKLGVINNGTLFRDIQTWMALKRGKHDPHSRIGEHKSDSTTEFDLMMIEMEKSYKKDYIFHQKEARKDPELVKWFLKDNYFDYRLPIK